MSTQMSVEDKFCGRFISKETSMAAAPNSSFRVYYGGVSGAVPFTWESRPGTPKHPLSHIHSTSLPPLTPPPSYYSYHSESTAFRRRGCSRSRLFHSFWSKINLRSSSLRTPRSPLSSSSWSSCSSSTRSSSSSVPSTPSSLRRRNYQRRNWESFDDHHSESVHDDDTGGWRTPCFSFGRQMKGGSIRDVYAVGIAKKALQTLMGRGSV